jgi:hypothetical protein
MLHEVRHDRGSDQGEEIAHALGYPHCVTVEGHRGDDGAEGLAVLARVGLDGAHAEALPPPSDPPRRVLVAQYGWTGSPSRWSAATRSLSPNRLDALRSVRCFGDAASR